MPHTLGSCYDDKRRRGREGEKEGGEGHLECFRSNAPPGVNTRKVDN